MLEKRNPTASRDPLDQPGTGHIVCFQSHPLLSFMHPKPCILLYSMILKRKRSGSHIRQIDLGDTAATNRGALFENVIGPLPMDISYQMSCINTQKMSGAD
jgi:hypothetical protein